jgi:hypothetical protein
MGSTERIYANLVNDNNFGNDDRIAKPLVKLDK